MMVFVHGLRFVSSPTLSEGFVRLLLLSGIHLADPCVPVVMGLYEMNDIMYRAVLGTVATTRTLDGVYQPSTRTALDAPPRGSPSSSALFQGSLCATTCVLVLMEILGALGVYAL